MPKGITTPRPGVVASCGHSANGKAGDAYQSFAQGLAKQGYVVLIYDPIGQGERLQYTNEQFKPRRGVGVSEHIYAGNQQFLVGEFFGMWRAWDGIRALDYLLTREEVDPKHVGITGNSGGGTLTTWLCGLDRRWTMAAPGCFVTTFRRNLENELPADTEQCPPWAIGLGLDHADFLAAMAPKPVIILAKERDFFDVRGATEAFSRLKHLYELLGFPDHVKLHVGPTEHGYSIENREAMYHWFNRFTATPDVEKEPPITIEPDAAIECMPHGQVAEKGSQTVFGFTKIRSEQLRNSRRKLEGDDLTRAVVKVLNLKELPAEPPEFRILRPLRSRKYPVNGATHYAVETETGIHAIVTRLGTPALVSRPPQDPRPAILYVSHQSADVELRSEKILIDRIKRRSDEVVYACDVRGVGESRPDTCGTDQFLAPYGSDFFYSAHAIMLGRPYLGLKTWDVLRVIQWLVAHGHREVHVLAKGWGTLPATFASLLSDRVTEVTLRQSLESYGAIAENEEYNWPLACLIPGVLAEWDLPDCYRELGKRKKLEQVDVQGAVAKFESE